MKYVGKSWVRLLIVPPILSIAVSSAVAQVTARQGLPDGAAAKRRFESPMILELPLPLGDRQSWGAGAIRDEGNIAAMSRNICEGVSIVDFIVTPSRPDSKDKVPIVYDFTLENENGGVDKLTSVVFELLSGDRSLIAKTAIGGIDTEEGKRASRRVQMLVPSSLLESAQSPVLQLTVHVAAND